MDENYFVENDKFLSMNGILGRRNFVINTLIIEIIKTLIGSTPFVYFVLFNPKYIPELSVINNISNLPVWALIWICAMGLVSTALYFPSIVRRVRDIIGDIDDNRVYLVSSVLSVIIFVAYTPVGANFWGKWFSFFVILVLIFQKGKISSQRPINTLIKFNWGAFLGTWIWGLFNKAPMTVFMLPLCLTFGWFPFMLICGLKGNEWAAKSEDIEDETIFHKNQEKQSVIWAVLTPIIILLGSFAMIIGSSVLAYNYGKAHPEFKTQLVKISDSYQDAAIKSNFTKIDLKKDSYSFYIEPEIWNKLSQSYKIKMFDMAANYAASQYKKPETRLKEMEKYPFDVVSMNKTKIYSSFNNEVLASFDLDLQEYSKNLKSAKSLSDIMFLTNSGYKINSNPTLP